MGELLELQPSIRRLSIVGNECVDGNEMRVIKADVENNLRIAANTLPRTSKALISGLDQADAFSKDISAAIARLEKVLACSTAERKRGEDEVSGFFRAMRDLIDSKEKEMLRDVDGIFDLRDAESRRRIEELLNQQKKLTKASTEVHNLQQKTASVALGSLNSPLSELVEALECSALSIEHEGQMHREEEPQNLLKSGTEFHGTKFRFCDNQSIQRSIDSIEVTNVDSIHPTIILVGTPESTAVELDKIKEDLEVRLRSASSIAFESNHVNGSTSETPQTRTADDINESQNHRAFSGKVHAKAVIPFDPSHKHKGVLRYMGTRENLQSFCNPALFSPDDDHLVVLRASSCVEGDLATLTGFKHYDGAFFQSDSALGSWVSVEIRGGTLMPTHYSLGYYINGSDHVPRNWVLQGSQDNVSFVNLKVHENDTSLDTKPHIASWELSEKNNERGPFQYFRILQTGPTSSGTLFLVLSFIEFYGILFENN